MFFEITENSGQIRYYFFQHWLENLLLMFLSILITYMYSHCRRLLAYIKRTIAKGRRWMGIVLGFAQRRRLLRIAIFPKWEKKWKKLVAVHHNTCKNVNDMARKTLLLWTYFGGEHYENWFFEKCLNRRKLQLELSSPAEKSFNLYRAVKVMNQ